MKKKTKHGYVKPSINKKRIKANFFKSARILDSGMFESHVLLASGGCCVCEPCNWCVM